MLPDGWNFKWFQGLRGSKPSFRMGSKPMDIKLSERQELGSGRDWWIDGLVDSRIRRFADCCARVYGNAKTKIEFVACGTRASGIVSVTMLLLHEPPPVPTGTATYCLPLTA